MPSLLIRLKTWSRPGAARSVTPHIELVVVLNGYSLTALITLRRNPDPTSSGVVVSVRYSVMSGVNWTVLDALTMRARYSAAATTVSMGGTRFGITRAR